MTTARQTAGMTYYRRDNGILVYRFQNNHRETVDAWIEQVYQDELVILAEGGIACILLDLRGQWVTPYAIMRVVKAVNRIVRGLKERVAVVAGENFTLSVVRGIIHKLPEPWQLSLRFFQSEADAMHWLEQKQHEFEAEKKNA